MLVATNQPLSTTDNEHVGSTVSQYIELNSLKPTVSSIALANVALKDQNIGGATTVKAAATITATAPTLSTAALNQLEQGWKYYSETKSSSLLSFRNDSGYVVPTSYTYISQGFTSYHPGQDLAAPLGTPIHATKAGCLISQGTGWSGGYGNNWIEDLGDNYSARYAHLQHFASGLKVGSCVQAGDLIGYVGSTGHSTGPHLHFELRFKGVAFNPGI